jgi:hypothetical protein
MVEILVALFLAFIVIWGLTIFAGEGGVAKPHGPYFCCSSSPSWQEVSG